MNHWTRQRRSMAPRQQVEDPPLWIPLEMPWLARWFDGFR